MPKNKKKANEAWRPEMFPIDSNEIKEACGYLSELIKINTTNPPGNEIEAANFCKALLEKEGFENIEILRSDPKRGNIVCRWKGSDPNAKSLLLLAHLDVVPADASNWERDPFCGDIEGEYVWGRGTIDCKNLVVSEMMAAFILKREGFQPKGDIILAFTADEEAGGVMGVGYLAENHWDKIKADYTINEGGGFLLPLGKEPKDYIVQTGEKGVFWTKIKVKGQGGHGSIPLKKSDNAMYKISKITEKLIEYKYPIEITQPVREMAQMISLPKIAKKILLSKRLVRPFVNLAEKIIKQPLSRIIIPFITDIINPTGLKASEKVNVIPQYTEMTFDCRLLPGHDRENVKNLLRKALGKKLFREIEIIPVEPTQPATVNSIDNPFWKLVEVIINEMHKGARLVPMLSPGSTDSKFIRERGNYALGFCPMRKDPNMTLVEMSEMAHGKDERMWIPNLSYSIEFFYRLIKKF
jgi:acetylornithine deacetylase/succinyl-diaminopimelate desuccinylase-like protein